MNKLGKITVKHFLNTKLKSDQDNCYPVYISIWFQNKLTRMPSMYWIFNPIGGTNNEVGDVNSGDLAEMFTMDQKQFKNGSGFDQAFNEETRAIQSIVSFYWLNYNVNILSHNPSWIIRESLRPASEILNIHFKQQFQSDLSKHDSSAKQISAWLMIDWQTFSFVNIYEGLETISNDGTNKTKFYTEILSKYTSDYKFLKSLYTFEHERTYRVWEVFDEMGQFKNDLLKFKKLKSFPVEEEKVFSKLERCARLHKTLIEVVLKSKKKLQ